MEEQADTDKGGSLWFLWVIIAVLTFRVIGNAPRVDGFFTELPNDSAMRLAVIRDLLGGQGWFDMSMSRLGPDDGFDIHWSRLVDGPIAALIWLFDRFTSRDMAEYLALTIWPLAFYAAAVMLAAMVARRLAGQIAGLATGLITALSFAGNRIFKPGAIDHHNVQLVMLLVVVLSLVARNRPGAALAGGLAMALSLAVGVETLPHLALAGVAVALIWLTGGEGERTPTLAFAAGLGVGLPLMFAVSAPASAWAGGYCDAVSMDLVAPVTLGAAGLAMIAATLSNRAFGARLAGLAILGAVVGLITVLAYPACLSNPYDALDPYLRDHWLILVTEAQSLPAILDYAFVPKLYLGYYILALVAAAISLNFASRDREQRAAWLAIALLLLASVVMAYYQVRGVLAATLLAGLPIGCQIAAWRNHWRQTGRPLTAVLALFLLFAALPISWWTIATLATKALTGAPPPAALTGPAPGQDDELPCFTSAAIAQVAALPRGLISANSNLGAQLLLNTPHQVLSAPYHRNQTGMRAELEILLAADEAEAHDNLQAIGADYVVMCSTDPELQGLADFGFEGFGHDLVDGQVPPWLTPIPLSDDSALLAWRVD